MSPATNQRLREEEERVIDRPAIGSRAPACTWQPIERPGLRLRLSRDWLAAQGLVSAALMEDLVAAVPWRSDTIRLFGRTHVQPRLMCWMADPGCRYRYSGRSQAIDPWHPLVDQLRDRLSRLAGCRFNSVLLNLYRHGDDAMGWHADDEPELDDTAPIASLSLGCRRSLRFRPRSRPDPERVALELGEGDLLLMDSPTQRHWLHGLPRRRRVAGARLNLTFRVVRPAASATGAAVTGAGR
ncbi:alpha-ketoglutarate-dependent dioxygenase AlkB [Synechococcus sp. RSCCF101]|uniref:alpha-ketoglutarate-dependent dioxygenase AlkB family protein n=1 Tax=Synechococcus sp. RSCCF101 TaxID=2511069 RepID=UPI0012461593|nr:alpha-ketoglutarate-dependent dioxygenase AlkB [Synechococcus sp. RSCCF101]QEY31078.1 alpha-ketoglutarate-dependent dioxygenase AlkB [Synechococcus sp. RSCCF101]